MAGAGSSAPPSPSLGVRLAGALLAMLVPTVVLGVVGIAVLVKSNEAASTLHDEVVNEARVMGELRAQLRTAALDVERALVLHDPAGPARFAEKSRRVDELFSGIESFDEPSEKQAASQAQEAWIRARHGPSPLRQPSSWMRRASRPWSHFTRRPRALWFKWAGPRRSPWMRSSLKGR